MFLVIYVVVAAVIALLISLPIRAGYRKGRPQLIALSMAAGLIVTGAVVVRLLAIFGCPEFLLTGLLVPVGIVVGALLIGLGFGSDKPAVGAAGTLMALFSGAGLLLLGSYCTS